MKQKDCICLLILPLLSAQLKIMGVCPSRKCDVKCNQCCHLNHHIPPGNMKCAKLMILMITLCVALQTTAWETSLYIQPLQLNNRVLNWCPCLVCVGRFGSIAWPSKPRLPIRLATVPAPVWQTNQSRSPVRGLQDGGFHYPASYTIALIAR